MDVIKKLIQKHINMSEEESKNFKKKADELWKKYENTKYEDEEFEIVTPNELIKIHELMDIDKEEEKTNK